MNVERSSTGIYLAATVHHVCDVPDAKILRKGCYYSMLLEGNRSDWTELRDSLEKKKKEPSRKKSSPNFPSILWLESEPGCESVVSETDLRSGHRCTLVLYSQQPSFSGDLRAPVFFFLRKLRVDRPGDNGWGLDTFSSHSKDSVLYFE